MIASAFGVLFDGFAYGMLLFLLSVGLSVTLGMMNFVNLAHLSFAMLGGYVAVTLTNDFRWPFLAALPAAFLAAAVVSVAFERVLYRRLYRATDLDQCLLTIGIVFVSVAVAAYLYGTIQQAVRLPSYLRGSVSLLGQSFGTYRLFLIAMALLITALVAAARRCAPRSTTSAWHARSVSTSTRFLPSPSRWAAAWPGSAARWRSRSSASITHSPSPFWSTC